MRTKEIIKKINIYGINVVYVTQEELHNDMDKINSSLPIYFTPLNSDEEQRFNRSKNKENFVSQKPEIQFLDCHSEELTKKIEISDRYLHMYTVKQIEPFLQSNLGLDVIYTIYIFLHEIGHYKQFIRLESKAHAYMNQDLELRKSHYYKTQDFHASIPEDRMHYTLDEEIYLKKLMRDYRKIPMEKDADEFALNHLEEALNLYKSKI